MGAFQIVRSHLSAFVLWPWQSKHEPRLWFGKENLEVSGVDVTASHDLQSSNAKVVQRLLTHKALKFFGRTPGWSIQGGLDELIIYQQNERRVGPDRFDRSLREHAMPRDGS